MQIEDGRLLVLSRAVPGAVGSFHDWYDHEHVPETLAAFSDVTGVRRYALTERLSVAAEGLPAYDSLAVYRTRRPARDVWEEIRRSRELGTSPVFDYSSVVALFI